MTIKELFKWYDEAAEDFLDMVGICKKEQAVIPPAELPPLDLKESEEEEVIKSEEKLFDDSFVKELLINNKSGFACGKYHGDLRELSVHIFPFKNGIRITFVVNPSEFIDWRDIDNLFESNDKESIKQRLKSLTKKRPTKKLFVKLNNYGDNGNITWIPLHTNLLPELSEEFTGDSLYTKDRQCIGYAEAFRQHKLSFSKLPKVFYESFCNEFRNRAKTHYTLFPTNEVIYTATYTVYTTGPHKKTLEEVSDVLENKLYGLPLVKNNMEVKKIMNFVIHKSSKYIDGMFSFGLSYDGSEFSNKEIKF